MADRVTGGDSAVVIRVVCHRHRNTELFRLVAPTVVREGAMPGSFTVNGKAMPRSAVTVRWDTAPPQPKWSRRCRVSDHGVRCQVHLELSAEHAAAILGHIVFVGPDPESFRVGLSRMWTVTDQAMIQLVGRPELAEPALDALAARSPESSCGP